MITLDKMEQAVSDLHMALATATENVPVLQMRRPVLERKLVVCRAQAEKAAVLCAEIQTAMEKLDLNP